MIVRRRPALGCVSPRFLLHLGVFRQTSNMAEYLFKTLVIGDPGIGTKIAVLGLATWHVLRSRFARSLAGKSSIIRRYVNDDFKHGYLFTIGGTHLPKLVDVFSQTLPRPPQSTLRSRTSRSGRITCGCSCGTLPGKSGSTR